MRQLRNKNHARLNCYRDSGLRRSGDGRPTDLQATHGSVRGSPQRMGPDILLSPRETVTNTGPTIINTGNLWVDPGTAVTGFPPGIVQIPGTITGPGGAAALAQLATTAAYVNLAGQTCPVSNTFGVPTRRSWWLTRSLPLDDRRRVPAMDECVQLRSAPKGAHHAASAIGRNFPRCLMQRACDPKGSAQQARISGTPCVRIPGKSYVGIPYLSRQKSRSRLTP